MRPSKKKTKCPVTHKIQYTSERSAERVLIQTQEKRGDKGAKRIYICTHCCFFHLTNVETDEKFNNTVEDKKLKYFDRWLNIINDIKNDTLGTVQTDKRDKTRLIPRGTSSAVFTNLTSIVFKDKNNGFRSEKHRKTREQI